MKMKLNKTKIKQTKIPIGIFMECIKFIDQFEESQHTDYIETFIYKNVLSI